MSIVLGLVLIILGLLAASNVVAGLSQDAAEFIEEHLRPVQSWLGLVGCAIGVLFLLRAFLSSGDVKSAGMMAMVAGYLGPLLLSATGFLMGFSKIMSFLGSDEDVEARALEVYQTLSPYQAALGLASVAVGAWTVLL